MKHTTQAITEAACKVVASQAEFPVTMMSLRIAISKELNEGAYGPYDASAEVRMSRIINQMAGDGELRKVARGQYGPDERRNASRQPLFWSPAAWDAAVAKYGKSVQDRQAIRERREAIWDELDRRGYTPSTPRGDSIRLSIASWNGLLGLPED
jgi:hypothetical protein